MLFSCPENVPSPVFVIVKTIWSFASPAPSAPFQVPARSLSAFAACPAVRAGNTPISAIAVLNATNVAICRLDIMLTAPGPRCLSIFCPIFWCKTPPDFIQQAFRFSWPRVHHPESSRGWVFIVKVFFKAFFCEPGATELRYYRPRQRPWHLSFRLVRLPPPNDRQQPAF